MYYLFSTIAQVLVAVAALVSLFWVFFIPILEHQLRIWGAAVGREIDPDDDRKNDYRKKLQEAVEKDANESHGTEYVKRLSLRISWSIQQDDFKWLYDNFLRMNAYVANPIIKDVIARYESIDNKRHRMTRMLKIVLISSGILILFNLVGIALVQIITCLSIGSLILWIDIILGGIIVVLSVYSISSLVKVDTPIKEKR